MSAEFPKQETTEDKIATLRAQIEALEATQKVVPEVIPETSVPTAPENQAVMSAQDPAKMEQQAATEAADLAAAQERLGMIPPQIEKSRSHETSAETEKWEAFKKEIDELQEASRSALIEAYGSVEEAERYAKMNLTERILRANPRSDLDMGIEENLADKIHYARNYLGVLDDGNQAKSILESDHVGAKHLIVKERMLPDLRDLFMSTKTSGQRHFVKNNAAAV